MSVSEILAAQWYTHVGGYCQGDTDCGPWVCEGSACVDPATVGREMPRRGNFVYYDTSCSRDADCGVWACVEGWCRDRELLCGDGVVQDTEECDDGNEIDTDLCRNNCEMPTCGDGIVSNYIAEVTLEAPVVTNPWGVTGHVCDDGASTYNATLDLSQMPNAPEHGICEALGHHHATSVTWGYGPGENDSTMPHAYNWECTNFDCRGSSNTYSSDNCSSSEMLASISCESVQHETCDEGVNNSWEPWCCMPTDLPRSRLRRRRGRPGRRVR